MTWCRPGSPHVLAPSRQHRDLTLTCLLLGWPPLGTATGKCAEPTRGGKLQACPLFGSRRDPSQAKGTDGPRRRALGSMHPRLPTESWALAHGSSAINICVSQRRDGFQPGSRPLPAAAPRGPCEGPGTPLARQALAYFPGQSEVSMEND